MRKSEIVLNYLKVLIWPILLVLFIVVFYSSLRALIDNIVEARKVEIGSWIKWERRATELRTKLIEQAERELPYETVYTVVKTFKDFQETISRGRESELDQYFSRRNPERDNDIKQWRDVLNTPLSIKVMDITQHGQEIEVYIHAYLDDTEWETPVTLIMEGERWRFIK